MQHTFDEQVAARCAEMPDRASISRAVKRLLDFVLSVAILLLCAPLLAFIAIAIRIQDRGPVLHRRRVVGSDGEFDAFKFRTMRVDADEWLVAHPELFQEFQKNFKLAKDPRVTKLGEFLRRTSLDELPQLLNVVLGQMSIVGPRMITRPELEKYGVDAALLRAVRPGVTGYWQVFGRRAGGYQERVAMDLYYIRNWSLMFDCKILLHTPYRVLRGQAEV